VVCAEPASKPGYEHDDILKAAGADDAILEHWWATNGDLSTWTLEEQNALKQMALDMGRYLQDSVAGAERRVEIVKELDDELQNKAILLLNREGFPTTLEEIREKQALYHKPVSEGGQGGKGTPVKVLGRYWDIIDDLRDNSPLVAKYYISPRQESGGSQVRPHRDAYGKTNCLLARTGWTALTCRNWSKTSAIRPSATR